MLTRVANEARRLVQEDFGPTTVEYAMLLALIGIAVLVCASHLGQLVRGIFASAAERIDSVNR